MSNVFKQAVVTFGEKHQKVKAIEELSELIQALTKDLGKQPHNVEEEIADCYIMLSQLEMIYDNQKVYEIYRQKIERLNAMLDKVVNNV